MDRWIGKTAVVTGASGGIGAAVSVAFASAGINVVGLSRKPTATDELQNKVTGNGVIKSVKCDVAVPEDVAAAFKWISDNVGSFHIIVNNASVLVKGHITDVDGNMMSDKDLLATIDTNYKGLVMCTRHAIKAMRANSIDGHIININSIAGHQLPFGTTFNVYPSTKYAITAFTAGLINELADHKNKIKVTNLSPGLVNTQVGTTHAHIHKDSPALRPEDIADAALYALSTPPNVNINEIIMTSVSEKKL